MKQMNVESELLELGYKIEYGKGWMACDRGEKPPADANHIYLNGYADRYAREQALTNQSLMAEV